MMRRVVLCGRIDGVDPSSVFSREESVTGFLCKVCLELLIACARNFTWCCLYLLEGMVYFIAAP